MPAEASDNDDACACSFCGRSRQHVDTLIQGPGVVICDRCVQLCAEIVLEHSYVACFYCGTRAYQTDSFHVDAVHGICIKCASALGKEPDSAKHPALPSTHSKNEGMCSFCEKHARYVSQVIAGPGVNIYDECVHACVTLIAEEKEDP